MGPSRSGLLKKLNRIPGNTALKTRFSHGFSFRLGRADGD
jgi:hypothetical protein